MSISSIKRVGVTLAKKSLAVAGIEPATVKAAIRRPKSANGGFKVRRWPWPRRKHLGKKERLAALTVLNREIQVGNSVIYGGPESKAYCDAFTRYLGGGYAVPVNSGTNAVYVALRSLDLPPGSEVIVPAVSDPGGVMPVAMMNCVPIAADTAPGSLNCSVNEIAAVVTDKTRAIIVTHIAGIPVDMDPIIELARSRGIAIVEDCAQSHGTTYKGQLAGTLGDIAAFSTMFGKQHCTGGQGGVVYTRNTILLARARQITDRGKPFSVVGGSTNIVASLNFNQDEISLAIGRVQLAKLPQAIVRRRAFALAAINQLQQVPGVTAIGDPEFGQSSFWFMLLRLDDRILNCNAAKFAVALAEEGIGGVTTGYPFYPVLQPWYQDGNFFAKNNALVDRKIANDRLVGAKLANALLSNANLVRVDVHESLKNKDARDLAQAVIKVANHFRKSA
jgi:perosamine synthetase